MLTSRRIAPLLAIAAAVFLFLTLQSAIKGRIWRDVPQVVGLGEVVSDDSGDSAGRTSNSLSDGGGQIKGQPVKNGELIFIPGTLPAAGHNYSKVLVIPKVKDANTDWIHEKMPDLATAIYVADDPSAPLHPPKNKGNEVMIYLTYIIDHYDNLPDVSMFMHSHRYAWHNNDILNNDAYEMITRLSSERVTREGYLNLRCHWNPGCPAWIHPGRIEINGDKREEKELARVWSELFPRDPIPNVLAQPCCSQFAVSRQRIRAIPLARFVAYRDWLMRTDLSTYLSGRVWEYLWQYAFTGSALFCPDQHVCYCDGYGVCFEDGKRFDYWFELKFKQRDLQKKLDAWQAKAKRIAEAGARGGVKESDHLEVPEVGEDVSLKAEIKQMQTTLDQDRDAAVIRGNDPKMRAYIAGRQWHEGDWY